MSQILPALHDDAEAIAELARWAAVHALPQHFIARIGELARRDPKKTREIADALAELGYPWTANDLRARWAPRTP